MNNQNIRLVVFDIDGTISQKGIVQESVLQGIRTLHSLGIMTTIMAGSGYNRVKKVLGQHWNDIVTPGIPVGLENGGRIVDTTSQTNLVYFRLGSEEITRILRIVSQQPVEFLLYYPESLTYKAVLWTLDQARVNKHTLESATVVDQPLADLMTKIQQDNPCRIVIRPGKGFRPTSLRSVNAVENEGFIDVNAQATDKGRGLIELSNIARIPLKQIMVVGNAENDLPMFEQAVAQRILVGNRLTLPGIDTVNTINDLGLLLSGYDDISLDPRGHLSS